MSRRQLRIKEQIDDKGKGCDKRDIEVSAQDES